MALYSEKVMDHFRNPRNVGVIEDADGIGEVGNAKCGDIMKMYLKIENDIITDVKFETFGCGSAIASSSMATELIKGKPVSDALALTNKAVAEALDRLASEGHQLVHAINISTTGDRIVELAEKVQSWGAKQIMVDVITCGFAAVQAIAEDPSIKVPIHVHRTMHGALTRDPLHGISMLPITKLVRMCGGDALHIGTLGVGKMSGNAGADLNNLYACLDPCRGYKTVMPVCSGGVYPGMVGKMVQASGKTVQIQAGGGVAGHPGGVRKGAMAMCQAVDAAFYDIPVREYAKDHEELRIALEMWGSK